MHILMVAPQPFFEPRGTPLSVLQRIRALVHLGHTVDLLTYPFGTSPELPGLSVHRVPRPPGLRRVKIGPSLAKLVLDVPLFALALRRAHSGTYDLVHTHEEAGLVGAFISSRTGLPHLYDMHSSLPQQFTNFDRYRWAPVVAFFRHAERYTLRRSDAVIAICPQLAEHARAVGYTGPLAVIENTFDLGRQRVSPEEVAALRARLGLQAARPVVYTGTLEAYQGVDLLVEAMADVARRVADAVLVVVGGTLEQLRCLQERADRLGLTGRAVFLPAVPPDQVGAFHQIADVLVTTRTRGTNTPLKIYEYLRAGRPIVATAIHSHTQVLDSACAELVALAPEAIADGIVRVLTDRARAVSLAQEATRRARERYTTDDYLARLNSLLTELGQTRRHLRRKEPASQQPELQRRRFLS